MNRFYHPESLSVYQEVTLLDFASNHIANVLRFKIGKEIILFNGDGKDYLGFIQHIEKKKVTIKIKSVRQNNCASSIKVNLMQAITSKDKLDLICQKTTELGVKDIELIPTERSNFKIPITKVESRIKHLQNVTISACEQSGRALIPSVNLASSLQKSLANKLDDKDAIKIILDPCAETLIGDFQPQIESPLNFYILVGPEGGFTKNEVNLAINNNFIALRMGSRILRTESASLVILSSLHTLFGDFV